MQEEAQVRPSSLQLPNEAAAAATEHQLEIST